MAPGVGTAAAASGPRMRSPEPGVSKQTMNTLSIRVVDAWTPSLAEAFGRLLPQLSPALRPPSEREIRVMVESPATVLFAAWRGTRIVGLLTLTWYRVPSGCKAWIEDVVVDEAARGLGIGERLVRTALERAAAEGVGRVMLTSRASRRAAHALYHKTGFEEVDTVVFARNVDKS